MGAPEWIARFQSLLAAAVHARSTLTHAAQRLPGFKFDETMAGTVSFVGGDLPEGEREIVLRLRAFAPRFGSYLAEGRTSLVGTATIPELAAATPLSGSLWIWPHRRIVRYECFFSVAGKRLRLAGQKDVRLLDFRHTMSTLPATLYDESGAIVGHATVLFAWADLPSFLRSFALFTDESDRSPSDPRPHADHAVQEPAGLRQSSTRP